MPVSSLAERSEDIPLLIEHILTRLATSQQQTRPSLDPEAQAALQAYHFPGNIRELENILERAYTLCENTLITEADLNLQTDKQAADNTTHNEAAVPLETTLDNKEKELLIRALEKTKWNRTQAAKELGITFRALRYKLKKLGLD